MIEITIKLNDEGQTIIRFLKKMVDYKEQHINLYKLFRTKKIKVNNEVIKEPKFILSAGDQVKIFYDLEFKTIRDQVTKTAEKVEVVYEDQNLLIVIKRHNLLVHNSHGDSLDNIVKNYLISKNAYNSSEMQSFVVSHLHRLDKLTKGLVIYAKNKKTLDYFLTKINKFDVIEKKYLLECEGMFNKTDFSLKGFIYHDEDNKKMIFSKSKPINIRSAKECETIFNTVEKSLSKSIVEAMLLTGRKNQIRASMEFLKHPITNDFKYGAKHRAKENWINLFAYKITFKNLTEDFAYLNDKVVTIPVKFN